MRFSQQMRDLNWLVARPIAHRGLHDANKIENSESAFAAAIKHNYAIECDVQLTADGEAMVFHDDTVERLLDGLGPVKSFTTSHLKKRSFKNSPDRVQTLGELLEQVAGRVTLVIELKTLWDGNLALAQRSAEILKAYDGPCALMSYDPEMITHLANASPTIIRGIIGEQLADDTYKYLPAEQNLALRRLSHLPHTNPHFISYYFRDLPCQPVAQFRAAGNPVITFTIRNREQEAYAKRYCDQVTFQDYLA